MKTCVVTGANAGIGFETAKALAAKDWDVTLLCRNKEKGATARDEIIKATGNEKVSLVTADLASQQEIRDAAGQIRQKYPNLDVLVNNAGTWFSKRIETEDGLEMQWAVNHMAYIVLTHELLPNLMQGDEGRIVLVASDSHINAKRKFIDPAMDLEMKKSYNGIDSYRRSKLGNVLFTQELAPKLEGTGVTINALQPGLVKTDIGHKHTIGWHSIAWWFRKSAGVSPEEGAQTSIYLASSPEAKGINGKYWDKCETKPAGKLTFDQDLQKSIWDLSMQQAGIEEFVPSSLQQA